MANLWQFFGLPDPEGNAPAQRSAPSTLSEEPTAVSLEASPSETTPSPPLTEDEGPAPVLHVPKGDVRPPPFGMDRPRHSGWRGVPRPRSSSAEALGSSEQSIAIHRT